MHVYRRDVYSVFMKGKLCLYLIFTIFQYLL